MPNVELQNAEFESQSPNLLIPQSPNSSIAYTMSLNHFRIRSTKRLKMLF